MSGQAAVSNALQDGVVVPLNDGLNSMRCVVCQKQMSGLTPVEQHLLGSSHKEAAAKYAMKYPTTAPPILLNLLQPLTKKAVNQGIIEVTTSGCTRCTVCGNALTGTRQIEDHLAGEDHKKKMNVQHVLPPTHPIVLNKPLQPPIFNPAPIVQPPRTLVGAVALPSADDELLNEALRAGHIIQTDRDTEPLVCIPCSKRFNGKSTLYEHLKSKDHKKKSLMAPNLTPGPSLNQTSVGKYSVKSSPRGLVHVFNYRFAGQGSKWVRDGAEHDSRNLRSTFKNMGYDISVHESLNKRNTWEMIERIRNDTRLHNVDSLIFFFLSHGKDAYTFHTNDQDVLNLFNIRNLFTNGECRQMKGKPKIFFMNYCRGDKMELRKVDGSSEHAESPDDMLTIHAAAEGIAAYRSAEKGTHFVASLCEILTSYGNTFNIRDIYLMLRDRMVERNSNKPMWEDYGFKEFHFNPV